MKMNQVIPALRFLFRKRLSISSDVVDCQINDFNYSLSPENIQNYNEVVTNTESQFKATQNPVFFSKINWQIIEKLDQLILEPFDGNILLNIVHQSEIIINHLPLNQNAELVVKSKVWSISPVKKGTKMMIKFEYYDNQQLITTAFSTGVLYGVKCIGEARQAGDVPKTARINDDPIWTESIKIDRSLPYEYAKKTQIDAEIHTDEAFAKSIGLPDIILQGTCSFAKAIEKIAEKELANIDFTVASVSTKFTGMLVPPNQLIIRLLKKEQQTFYFDVLNNKDEAVLKGGQFKYLVKH